MIKLTQFDDIEDYPRLVDAAKKAAGSRSVAEWELKIFNSPRLTNA